MKFDLSFYWVLLLRRLPVMALFILLFSGFGLVTAFKLPETYSTSARLLLEAPQIPDNMVRSTVQTGAAEQLEVIEQRLLTRANLIDIANRFNVFEDIRQMAPDTIVASMRAATTIRRRGGGTRAGGSAVMMVISFEANSPQIVANVVNEYVTLVLQENSRFRVGRAENTLEFFEQEVARLDEELSRRSVEIARFKSENAKALPQDQSSRLARQTVLNERLEQLNRELQTVTQARDDLESEFNAPRRAEVAARSAYEEQLLIGKAELERLRASYGESNPRIIRLKDRIERLEAIVAVGNSGVVTGNNGEEDRQAQLETAQADAAQQIAVLQAQIESTTLELAELAENISRSASTALELAELERDYQIIQTRYGSAVSNLNSARMGERIEATAQGQRINVIENANVPQVPSGPDRVLIAATGIFAGVGLAVAYFFLLEFLNRSVRRPAELVERFNVTPIATIPYMESRTRKFLRRGARMTAMIAVLVFVPLGLWYVDSTYLPLEVIVQRSLSKLGL